MSLLDLAARVEGLVHADRLVDQDIYQVAVLGEALDDSLLLSAPEYTKSLDAALSLVPSECAVSTGHAADGDPYHYVTFLSITDYATDEETEFEGRSNNWAASIVAAALRARAGASS